MTRSLHTASVLAVLLAFFADARAGPKYENKEHGFSIKLLSKWSQTPTQPGERIEVAKFKDSRKGAFAKLSIYRFAAPGGGEVTPAMEGDDPPPAPAFPGFQQPKSAKEYLEGEIGREATQIARTAVRMKLDVEIPAFPEPRAVKFGKLEGEIYIHRVEAIARMRYPGSFRVAGILSDGVTEFLILYSCAENRAKKLKSAFISSIRSFRFLEAEDIAEIDDDDPEGRIIGGKQEDLIDLAKRERIKKSLVANWRYIDTPHYIVIYNCDRPLAAYIAKRIEYMRTYAFEKVFPPLKPIEECMVVRVCKEMDEYYHYGGPRGSAGYWASYKDEFVFPDLSRSKKADDKTVGVLHHEGFHQYIYYCLLKNDPPVWFNEGCAEYFFCVEGWGKKLRFMKRHPMRYGTLKSALGTGGLIPLKDFVRLSHRQYMERAQLCYSQGWAFITWCKNVTRNERYREIPNIFFNELQKGYAELAGGGDQPGIPGLPPQFMGRDNSITKRALEKALEGIDMEKLHKDFLNDVKRKM